MDLKINFLFPSDMYAAFVLASLSFSVISSTFLDQTKQTRRCFQNSIVSLNFLKFSQEPTTYTKFVKISANIMK